MTDAEIMDEARQAYAASDVSIFPSDFGTVDVHERRHWWSLRKSWRRVGTISYDELRSLMAQPGEVSR